MKIIKYYLNGKTGVLACVLAVLHPLTAQSASESDRLEKLERAVELLQKQNAELKAEVSSLKSKQAGNPADAKFRTKITQDGKTYSEKAVVEEKAPIYVQQRGPELKLVLGGFIQVNAEGGAAFAFNGNFGQSAINDRFRLRRARINLTGDFAEQFDFKMEGDFANSDGLSNNRLAFEATDIWVNWHQFPAAQIKVGQMKTPFSRQELTSDGAASADVPTWGGTASCTPGTSRSPACSRRPGSGPASPGPGSPPDSRWPSRCRRCCC